MMLVILKNKYLLYQLLISDIASNTLDISLNRAHISQNTFDINDISDNKIPDLQ